VDTIEKVRDRLNPELEIQGVVATMYDGRTLHAREVIARVKEAFGTRLFQSTIPRTIRFAEAPVAGEPILTYAGDSRGAAAYRALAREVLGIVDDQESEPTGSGRAVQDDQLAEGTGDTDTRGSIDLSTNAFSSPDGGTPASENAATVDSEIYR
jgi:nitrogenase subunit NifH